VDIGSAQNTELFALNIGTDARRATRAGELFTEHLGDDEYQNGATEAASEKQINQGIARCGE